MTESCQYICFSIQEEHKKNIIFFRTIKEHNKNYINRGMVVTAMLRCQLLSKLHDCNPLGIGGGDQSYRDRTIISSQNSLSFNQHTCMLVSRYINNFLFLKNNYENPNYNLNNQYIN